MKLIAQMVGKNEADRYLPEVLEHIKGYADEIVFTDDASTDDTVEIAKSFGAHVYEEETTLFTENEGHLRSRAWRNLQNHAELGDWVLAIDCDEMLWATDPNNSLDKILRQTAFDVVNIQFRHMWNETQYRVDKLWAPHGSSRLFRYYIGGRFKDKKLACGSEPDYVQTLIRRGSFMQSSGLIMQHLGYVRDEDKQAKYDRYMLLDGGDFHAKNHIISIMDPEPTLQDWTY